MGDKSGIEWTNSTWNPVAGCSIVSPGCTNCYAMKMAARIERMSQSMNHYGGITKLVNGNAVWTGEVRIAPDHILTAPLRWKKPRLIFVNSMSDLFHEAVPDEWIDKVFAVMALCPQHTFQCLTKRSMRMREYMTDPAGAYRVGRCIVDFVIEQKIRPKDLSDANYPFEDGADEGDYTIKEWPLPNVWLGVSAEDQVRADERIPDLLATPAAIRFVSAEPLLGPLNLTKWFHDEECPHAEFLGDCTCHEPREITLDWIIVGGESDPGARPMHPDWARAIRDQCAAAGVAFFFKQWGQWAPGDVFGVVQHGPIADKRGNVRDWMKQYVVCEDRADHVVAHSFTGHATDLVYRVGKKRAGRLLDGIEHNAMPEVKA